MDSGITATADQPSRCLGIPPAAWALGGPVTHSGNLEDDEECEYDFDDDGDVDGKDLLVVIQGYNGDDDHNLSDFAEEFGREDCSPTT